MNPYKLYVGAKIIQAAPMNERKFYLSQKKEMKNDQNPPRDGYQVIYPDGYVSWSPKEVFENAYRLVTDGEIKLMEL